MVKLYSVNNLDGNLEEGCKLEEYLFHKNISYSLTLKKETDP